VYASRATPLQGRQLPAALVMTSGESVTLLSQAPMLERRALRLEVHVLVDGDERCDDVVDEVTEEVEQAIFEAGRLEGTVADIYLTGVEGPELFEPADRIVAAVRLMFEALYEVERQEAPEPTVDLRKVHGEWETHAPRAGAELAADVTVEVAP
jgi:hypothetical protein